MDKYKVMASNSIMFFQSSKVLKKVLDATALSEDKHIMANFFIPYIVNQAFAAEMAMKAILSKEAINYKKIHKLDELFYELPNQIQLDIADRIKTQFNFIHDEFEQQLCKVGSAFVDWRYFHEKSNSIKVDFFIAFSEMICNKCYELCKENGVNQHEISIQDTAIPDGSR